MHRIREDMTMMMMEVMITMVGITNTDHEVRDEYFLFFFFFDNVTMALI